MGWKKDSKGKKEKDAFWRADLRKKRKISREK